METVEASAKSLETYCRDKLVERIEWCISEKYCNLCTLLSAL